MTREINLYLHRMRRWVLLFSFCWVLISLTINIAAGVFVRDGEIEMIEIEKEKAGKEVDNEKEFEKDKIFQDKIVPFHFLTSRETGNLHLIVKISSGVPDAEINPPDIKVA
jgi:hypothetical protein